MTPDTAAQRPRQPWAEHCLWWHVYPLGFTGAPIRPDETSDLPGGSGRGPSSRLTHLTAWFDHVQQLGLNGVALGPVFASSTHGYDTVDHFRVDPRLGTEADLDELIAAAHQRGLRVLLDGVFNHVGRHHPAFEDLTRRGQEAPTADMFRVDWSRSTPGHVHAAVFEGHDQLVCLDHDSPAVADLVTRVMRHWLDRGVDGWRLDAAYAVPPHFWATVLPAVRATHPDVWFTGEVLHGDASRYVAESTVDSLTQYELWQGIWHSLADRNFYELAHALSRHDTLLETFVPTTFVGNHDVTRLASAVGADLVPHALAVLLTVAGIAWVYAGDEYGYLGIKENRLGGDDAVRPEFPAAPPVTEALTETERHLLETHQQLIGLRRRHPWLVRAHSEVVHLSNEQLVISTAATDQRLLTVVNIADTDCHLPTPGAREVLAGALHLTGDSGDSVRVPARGWGVLSTDRRA